MKLKVLGSGSSGNCYLLSHNDETLILDAGLPIKEIKIGLDFNLLGVAGALITHTHQDHSLSADDLKKLGIKVWKPYLEEKKIQTKQFGNFKVSCFDVPHDEVENRGFLIECDGEKLLYATDFEYIPYNFRKQEVDHLLIECNYIDEYVNLDAHNKGHVFKGHAELKTSLKVVEANKTNKLKNVVFCHLSKENSDSNKIIEEAKKVSSCPIEIAQKGIEVQLSLPF